MVTVVAGTAAVVDVSVGLEGGSKTVLTKLICKGELRRPSVMLRTLLKLDAFLEGWKIFLNFKICIRIDFVKLDFLPFPLFVDYQ